MTKPDYATATSEKAVIYDMKDELSQREIEKLLRLARAVKRGDLSLGVFELAYGKNDELYIAGMKRAA